jgi:hypothetical protein
MHGLPAGVDQFDLFYASRRERMLTKVKGLLDLGESGARLMPRPPKSRTSRDGRPRGRSQVFLDVP